MSKVSYSFQHNSGNLLPDSLFKGISSSSRLLTLVQTNPAKSESPSNTYKVFEFMDELSELGVKIQNRTDLCNKLLKHVDNQTFSLLINFIKKIYSSLTPVDLSIEGEIDPEDGSDLGLFFVYRLQEYTNESQRNVSNLAEEYPDKLAEQGLWFPLITDYRTAAEMP